MILLWYTMNIASGISIYYLKWEIHFVCHVYRAAAGEAIDICQGCRVGPCAIASPVVREGCGRGWGRTKVTIMRAQ